MSDAKAHVAVWIDFDGLASAGAPATPAGELAAAVLRYAGGVGRVTLARGYADWTAKAEDARAVQAARVVPVLSPSSPGGEGRAHVHLAVEAMAALYAGGEPDAFVIASADPRLLPLVQALRADGSDVLFLAPAQASVADCRAEADASATVEEVLAGAIGPASAPREVADEDEEEVEAGATESASTTGSTARPRADAARTGWGREPSARESSSREPSRDTSSREYETRSRDSGRGFGPIRGEGVGGARNTGWGAGPRGGARAPAPAAPLDFQNYDWASFVRLIDELEHRLPFVGVRYLVNKVLGPRNCGIDDPRFKRDLINRAVDEGILEMYEVGNVEDRRDPVTACRLDRKNAVVIGVLGAQTQTPVVPEAREGGEVEGGMIEGGLPLDATAGSDETA